tara:strand:- start:82 stop:285 length:204 start_codon:yes stop_codon:yes gene_type:complete
MENQEISINLKDALDISCNECESNYFVPAFQIKKISALVSPSGQETMIPIQLFQCSKCGHVNEDFLN